MLASSWFAASLHSQARALVAAAAVGPCQSWEPQGKVAWALLSPPQGHCSVASSRLSASCPSSACGSGFGSDLCHPNSDAHPILDCSSSLTRRPLGLSARQVGGRRSCPSLLARAADKCDNDWLNACVVVCIPDIAMGRCRSSWRQ